jgi:hypothetical protein
MKIHYWKISCTENVHIIHETCAKLWNENQMKQALGGKRIKKECSIAS